MDDKAISDVYWISGEGKDPRCFAFAEKYPSNDLNLDLLFMRKLQNNSAFPVGHGSDRTASSFSSSGAPNCDVDNLNEMEWREMTAEGGGRRLNVIPTDPNHEE